MNFIAPKLCAVQPSLASLHHKSVMSMFCQPIQSTQRLDFGSLYKPWGWVNWVLQIGISSFQVCSWTPNHPQYYSQCEGLSIVLLLRSQLSNSRLRPVALAYDDRAGHQNPNPQSVLLSLRSWLFGFLPNIQWGIMHPGLWVQLMSTFSRN